VAAVGHGGQVLVSEAAAVLVRDGLPPGAALANPGRHRLKDLGRPEQIFQLHAAGLQTEFPPLGSLGNPALPYGTLARQFRAAARRRASRCAHSRAVSSRRWSCGHFQPGSCP
jgi:hypothetical protein